MFKSKVLILKIVVITAISILLFQFVDKYLTQLLKKIITFKYLQEGDLMIVPSESVTLIAGTMIISLMFMVILINSYHKKVFLKNIELFAIVFLCSFVLFCVFSVFSYFTYTRVSSTGIQINGMTNHSFYNWDDLRLVEFQCKRSSVGKYSFDRVGYILRFKDNEYIDLANSSQFKSRFKEVEKHINDTIPHIKYIENDKLFDNFFSNEDKNYISNKFKKWNE